MKFRRNTPLGFRFQVMMYIVRNSFLLDFQFLILNLHFISFQIKWGAAALVLSGNVFIFLTILAYFLIFSGEDDWGI